MTELHNYDITPSLKKWVYLNASNNLFALLSSIDIELPISIAYSLDNKKENYYNIPLVYNFLIIRNYLYLITQLSILD